jgi:hypothetical protein
LLGLSRRGGSMVDATRLTRFGHHMCSAAFYARWMWTMGTDPAPSMTLAGTDDELAGGVVL